MNDQENLFFFVITKKQTNKLIDMDLKVQVKDEESSQTYKSHQKKRWKNLFQLTMENYTSIECHMKLYKEKWLNTP